MHMTNSIIKKSVLATCLACLPLSMATAEQYNEGYYLDGPQSQVQVGVSYLNADLKIDKNDHLKFKGPVARGQASFVIGDGWLIRPTALFGWKNPKQDIRANRLKATSYLSLDLALGKQIPLSEEFMVTPLIGLNWQRLQGYAKEKGEKGEYAKRVRERTDSFRLLSPYVGVEAVYSISSQMRIRGNAKYNFMTKGTCSEQNLWKVDGKKLKPDPIKAKGSANGPSFGLDCEYDIDECWSVNIGGSYSHRKTKEKKTKWKGKFVTKEAHIGVGYSF